MLFHGEFAVTVAVGVKLFFIILL